MARGGGWGPTADEDFENDDGGARVCGGRRRTVLKFGVDGEILKEQFFFISSFLCFFYFFIFFFRFVTSYNTLKIYAHAVSYNFAIIFQSFPLFYILFSSFLFILNFLHTYLK